jgi:hypothetical protein
MPELRPNRSRLSLLPRAVQFGYVFSRVGCYPALQAAFPLRAIRKSHKMS